MSVSARDVLAGVLAVQKRVLQPEEMAEAVAAGRSPGERLGVEWDVLCDEAEDRLAAARPASPNAPPLARAKPRARSSPLAAILCVVLLIAAVGLGVGLLFVQQSLSRTR